jgi:hypothetical protein
MNLFPAAGLAESIVQELRYGPQSTKDLIITLQKKHKVTVQGIYKSLRLLRAQGIIFLQNKEALLNLRWLQRLESFTSLAEHANKEPIIGSGHFLTLQDGDRITYSFKNPLQIDAFWNHVLYVLFDAIPNIDRWYAYASHCWFLLGRRKEEIVLKDFMKKRHIRYLFTVGHKLPLDRSITRDFDGVFSQYFMLDKPLFSHRSNHLGIVLNVLGDYVLEAQYDKYTVERIEQFYTKTHLATPETIAKLEEIVALPSKIRFTITKNSSKAKKLSLLFQKHFYFGKKYV